MKTRGVVRTINHCNGQSFRNELHDSIIAILHIQQNYLFLDHIDNWTPINFG